MATRALLPNIQLARARVKPQPRSETQKESEYRDTLQNIAATLGVIGQGVNIARATEPWWAGVGYGGAESPEIDAKASELSQQLADAYQSQAGQPQQAQATQPGQPQPERRGPSIMDRNDRRAAVQELAAGPAVAQPPQQAQQAGGPQFNRIEMNKREKMFVPNDQAAVRGGSGPLRREWDEQSTPVSVAQLQRQVIGDPRVVKFESDQEAQEAANQLRFDNTMARGKSWGYARKAAEENIAADEARQQQDFATREQARRQGWQYAAQAAEQDIADANQQEFFDAAAGAVPQEQLPPPPPADPVQRQAELLDIAKETADPAAVVAAEIDRFSSVPTFSTFRETQAALAGAVAKGDIDAAKLILQGASRSPMTDVRPTSLSDRLSGAHVRRAMTELTGMTQGMAGLQQRAQNALIRADLAERRLVLDREKAAATELHRAEQRDLAGQRLALAQEKAKSYAANIDSMIASRKVNDQMKAYLVPIRAALMRGQTAQAYAIARNAISSARGRDRIVVVDLANKLGDLYKAWKDAGGEEAGLGEAPTLENLPGKIEGGEPIAPVRQSAAGTTTEAYGKKKAIDVATDLTREIVGLGRKGGGTGKKDDLTGEEKAAMSQFSQVIAKFNHNSWEGQDALKRAIPALEAQAEQQTPRVRKLMIDRISAIKAAIEAEGEGTP